MNKKIKIDINYNQSFQLKRLKTITDINPFFEQRDIDKKRLKPLIEKFKKDLTDCGEIRLDTPLILLKCRDNKLNLIDKNNERVNQVIIDGQHRLEALKILQKYKSKIGELGIPVMIHLVESLDEGRKIQYDLFEQKPLDICDKIRKTNYNISEMIESVEKIFQSKEYKKINAKYIKSGTYDDGVHRPRKNHFLLDELRDKIRNSSNINIWLTKEIQPEELMSKINELILIKEEEFNNKPIDEQMIMVNIPKEVNFVKFNEIFKNNKFQILPYVYYKIYDKLVEDLERLLDIIVETDESESDDDEFQDF
jgi:hypothetical protein